MRFRGSHVIRIGKIRTIFVLTLALLAMVLSGCAQTTKTRHKTPLSFAWMQQAVDYRLTLPTDHPDQIANVLTLSEELKRTTRDIFGTLPKHIAVGRMSRWLMAEQGHHMQYDVSANLSPAQSFVSRKGNCLSFTMLLVNMAKVLDIDVYYNEVDIPDIWGSENDQEAVLYRHINAVQDKITEKHIFDLALQDYQVGYPQRRITETAAVARLYSNRAVDFLSRHDFPLAHHYAKLAISLSPDSSTFWANWGVVLLRGESIRRAEAALVYAMQLGSNNSLAASNLQRIYTKQGRVREADRYRAVAKRARQGNPYYHFKVSQRLYTSRDLGGAKLATVDKDKQRYSHKARMVEKLRQHSSVRQRFREQRALNRQVYDG